MKKNIFEYKDYKSYLLAFYYLPGKRGRGVRIAMAEALNGPVSHISQVLNGSSQLTLEQAEGLNEYLGHTEDESTVFFILVQYARAGTPQLKAFLKNTSDKLSSDV